MTDTRCFLVFVSYLAGLLEAGLPLSASLRIMAGSRKSGRKNALFAEKVFDLMKQGYSLSSALSLNGVIRVDRKNCSFLSAAENTDCLSRMLRFLSASENTRREYAGKLAGACIYPFVTALIAGIGCLVLVKNCNLLGFRSAPKDSLSFIASGSAVYLLFMVMFLRKGLSRAVVIPELLFFKAMSFFLSCGFDLKHSLSLVAMTGNLKAASVCGMLRDDVSAGVPFSKAVEKTRFCSEENLAFLELGEQSGRLEECCRTAADRVEKESQEVRSRFLRFGEPVLLLGTGLYVLFLAQNVILPFLMDYEYLF